MTAAVVALMFVVAVLTWLVGRLYARVERLERDR